MNFESNYIEFNESLSNFFSNEIIKKFTEINPQHSSNIEVVLNKKICLINGHTTISDPIDFSELLTQKFNELNNTETIIKTLDFVDYGKKITSDITTVTASYNLDEIKIDLKEKIKNLTDSKINFYLIPNTNKIIYNKKQNISDIDNFDLYEHKSFDTFFKSKPYYGSDIFSTKSYEFLLKNISYNLVHANLCNDIQITMFCDKNIKEINNENVELYFSSNTLRVSKEWLNSLVLDLFDFKLENIIENFNLTQYDFGKELFFSEEPMWKQKQRVKDIIPL